MSGRKPPAPFKVVTGDPGPAQHRETWADRLTMLADNYPGEWVDVNSTWGLKLAQHVKTRLRESVANTSHVRAEVVTRKVAVDGWIREHDGQPSRTIGVEVDGDRAVVTERWLDGTAVRRTVEVLSPFPEGALR